MKPNTYLVCLMSLLSTFGVAQTNLHTESFETDGEGSRYASSTFTGASGDYFLRDNGTFIDLEGDVSYGTADGSYFWVGEDLDELGSAGSNPFWPDGILQLQDVNVSGYSSLELKVLLAQTETPNANRFENDDYLLFQYAFDGQIGTVSGGGSSASGTYTDFAIFRGNVSGSNGSLALDTDLNGVGDGTALTTSFQDFTLSIPATGSTLSIRILMVSDADTEEIYMDNLRIEGTVACTDPDIPTVTATSPTICPSGSTSLQITGNLNDATAWNIYTGSCGGSLLGTTATSSFNVSPASTTTYYIRGEGGCVTPGSCGTVTVTVQDNTDPTITCPGNQTLIANSSCQASLPDYTGLATASDDCDASPTITQSPAPGTTVTGDVTVTLTATDASANTKQCNFNVVFSDTTRPSISCPGDQTVYASASCQTSLPNYTGLAVTTDNCDGSPVVTQSPTAGNPISANTVVTLTSTDASGNTNTCSFNVTFSDTTRPSISCPGDQTVYASASCQTTLPDYTGMASSTDNCDGSPVITQSPTAGTTITSNTTIVLTSTDATGNTNTCSFNVSFLDTISPSITCPGDQTVYATASCQVALSDYTGLAGTADNCDGSPVITQSPAPGTNISADTQVQLTSTDATGNTGTCVFNVVFSDTTRPVISCPSAQTLYANNSCQASLPDYTGMATSTDNCDGSPVITQSPSAGNIITADTMIVLTSTDASGNTDTCSFMVHFSDTTRPVLVCPSDQNAYVNGSCQATIGDYTSSVTLSDNCDGSPILTQAPPSGTVITADAVVTMTATDGSGNVATCTFNVLFTDTTKPVITCRTDTLICNPVFSYTPPIGTDQCAGAITTQTDGSGYTSGSTFPTGETVQQYTVTDAGGNQATCQFTVTVPPPSQANAGNDFFICSADGMLDGNVPQYGTGRWKLILGSAKVQDSLDPKSSITVLVPLPSVAYFEWFIQGPCDSSRDTVMVTRYAPVEPTVMVTDSLLTCNPVATTYQWFLNGDTIPGATNKTYVALVTGSYTVHVLDTNGCRDSSEIVNVIITGIADGGNPYQVEVFPNPFSQQINMGFTLPAGQTYRITMYNILGKAVAGGTGTASGGRQSHAMDAAALRPGVYFVSFESGQYKVMHKLIRE